MIIQAEWVSKRRAVAHLPGGGSVTYNYGADGTDGGWMKTSPTSWRIQCAEGSITIKTGDRSRPGEFAARDSVSLADAIGAEPKRSAGTSLSEYLLDLNGWTRTGQRSWWSEAQEGGVTVRVGDHSRPKSRRSAQDRAARSIGDSADALVGAIMRGAAPKGPGLETLIARQGWRKHT